MANHREPIAVIGLGRFGSSVAMELARRGNEVLAVDVHASTLQRLAGQLSQVVVADSTDIDALREVGVTDFERVVVAIGSDMQASILTTSLLSELEITQIWAKALSPEHARILQRVGAHHVVMPEHDMGLRIAHMVSDQMLDYLEVDHDWVVVKTKPPREMCGTALDNQRLIKRDVTVIAVKPEGEANFQHVSADTHLTYGDEVVVTGRPADIDSFIRMV